MNMRYQTIVAICALLLVVTLQSKAQDLSREALLADYDYFIEQLESVHPDPYTDLGGKDSFDLKVRALRKRLSAMDSLDVGVLQREVTKLISPLHDGHTRIGYFQDSHLYEDRWLPVRFRQINGYIIIDMAAQEYRELFGARITSIEGVAIDEICRRAGELFMAENPSGIVNNAVEMLSNNNRMSMLGITLEENMAHLGLKLQDDRDTIVALPLYGEDYFRQLKDVVAPDRDERLRMRNMQYQEIDGKMVFRLTAVESRDNLAFEKNNGMDYEQEMKYAWATFYDEPCPEDADSAISRLPVISHEFGAMLRQMRDHHVKDLIIDLRDNGGGWTPILYATMYQLFGDVYLKRDMETVYASKLSLLYLQKQGLTLEQFNEDGGNYKMGDFVYSRDGQGCSELNDFIRDSIIHSYICADYSEIENLKGEAIYRPEHIYVVTNASTFSAAFHYTFMLWKMGATVVGIPSGQAPNTFMEVTPFYLPNSGLDCSVSNAFQQFLPANHPCAKTLWPSIMPTYEDYRKYGFNPDADILMIYEK